MFTGAALDAALARDHVAGGDIAAARARLAAAGDYGRGWAALLPVAVPGFSRAEVRRALLLSASAGGGGLGAACGAVAGERLRRARRDARSPGGRDAMLATGVLADASEAWGAEDYLRKFDGIHAILAATLAKEARGERERGRADALDPRPFASPASRLGGAPLAALGAVGYCVVDGALDAAACAALRAALAPRLVAAEPSEDACNAGCRSLAVPLADPGPAAAGVAILAGAAASLDAPGLRLGVHSAAVASRYPPDSEARYAPHYDWTPHEAANAKFLTVLLYYGDWRPGDGGALRLHLDGGAVDADPREGRLVAFLSRTIRHEVLPSARAPRLALQLWADRL